jgi:hypothetical protein
MSIAFKTDSGHEKSIAGASLISSEYVAVDVKLGTFLVSGLKKWIMKCSLRKNINLRKCKIM